MGRQCLEHRRARPQSLHITVRCCAVTAGVTPSTKVEFQTAPLSLRKRKARRSGSNETWSKSEARYADRSISHDNHRRTLHLCSRIRFSEVLQNLCRQPPIAVQCSGLLIMYVPDCAPTGAVIAMLSPAGTSARVVWHAPGPVMNRVFTRFIPDSRFTLTPPAPAPSVATQTVTITRTFCTWLS
jgi:hypothetical protein